MSKADTMKFLSRVTKQEIIEAVFQEVSAVEVGKILSRIYFQKSERLLKENDELVKELGTAKTTGRFLECVKKLNKKNKEIDALHDAYLRLLEKKDG